MNTSDFRTEKRMETAILPALMGFVFAATITPGPNNIMVMTSGANFGFRRSIPHLLGVSLGALAVVLLTGFGLMAVFKAAPFLETALKIASAVYLVWLAWKIANAKPPEAGAAPGKPLTFLQAAAFQWVNPKVWATGLSAMTLFAPDRSVLSMLAIGLAFSTIGMGSNAVWTFMGTALRHWLTVGRRLRVFNVTMAILLVASIYPVFVH
jgi:threonine/homoserine/homoserine lactone efflux protein